MKRRLILLLLPWALLLSACGGEASVPAAATPVPTEAVQETEAPVIPPAETEMIAAVEAETPAEESAEEEEVLKLWIGEQEVEVRWEDNESVDALRELAAEGLTVELSGYGGFEQVGSLGRRLPRNDVQTVTEAGDIVLYSGSSIVLFYGSNSWAYTRLGKIQGLSNDELLELLGGGDVTVRLAMD